MCLTLRGSSVGQALGLLPNGHQFESPQGHWRFTRSLTSGPRGISRGARKLARTSTVIKKICHYVLGKVLLCDFVSLGLIVASYHEISGP